MKNKNIEFTEVFGNTKRIKVLAFFLYMPELDFCVGDLIKKLDMNRATAYNIIKELERDKYLIKSRVSCGRQLYNLNYKNEKVNLLSVIFELINHGFIKNYGKKLIIKNEDLVWICQPKIYDKYRDRKDLEVNK